MTRSKVNLHVYYQKLYRNKPKPEIVRKALNAQKRKDRHKRITDKRVQNEREEV